MGPYARFPAPRGCVPPPRFEGLRHTRCRPTAGTDRETVLPIRCRTSLAQSQTWISAGEPPRPAFSPACPLRCDVSPLTFFASIVGTPPAQWFSCSDSRSRRHGDRQATRPAGAPAPTPGHASAPKCHFGATTRKNVRPWTRRADHATHWAMHTTCAAHTRHRSRFRAKARYTGSRLALRAGISGPAAAILQVAHHWRRKVRDSNRLAYC